MQQRFVEKVVDEVIDSGNDHVLFQVDNESGIGDETLEPGPYWARFVRRYAESKGASDVFVCSCRRFHWPTPYKAATFQDWDNPDNRYSFRQVALDRWRRMKLDAHTQFADPLFVDRENNDYRLEPNSPALALGFQQINTSEIGLKKDFPYNAGGRHRQD